MGGFPQSPDLDPDAPGYSNSFLAPVPGWRAARPITVRETHALTCADNPYRINEADWAVLLTAAEPATTLAKGKRALVSALARNANSGFRILALNQKTILDNGKPTILLEPVRADVELARRTIARVNVLDHDGQPTGRTASASRSRFTIDTGKDRTIYYELLFAD